MQIAYDVKSLRRYRSVRLHQLVLAQPAPSFAPPTSSTYLAISEAASDSASLGFAGSAITARVEPSASVNRSALTDEHIETTSPMARIAMKCVVVTTRIPLSCRNRLQTANSGSGEPSYNDSVLPL